METNSISVCIVDDACELSIPRSLENPEGPKCKVIVRPHGGHRYFSALMGSGRTASFIDIFDTLEDAIKAATTASWALYRLSKRPTTAMRDRVAIWHRKLNDRREAA